MLQSKCIFSTCTFDSTNPTNTWIKTNEIAKKIITRPNETQPPKNCIYDRSKYNIYVNIYIKYTWAVTHIIAHLRELKMTNFYIIWTPRNIFSITRLVTVKNFHFTRKFRNTEIKCWLFHIWYARMPRSVYF